MLAKSKSVIPIRDLEHAWARINEEFPFKGYVRASRKSGYFEMVRKVVKWSSRDAMVLDFGAGPCDKTAILSLLGFDVTAFDDFKDDWYNIEGNRKKILSFAKSVGIDYYLPGYDGGFNFPNRQYDALVMNNVIEHLHDSPRELLNRLLEYLKPNGYFFMAVPNAANLRKRISLLFGRTIYAPFCNFYWSPGPWRGHNREYVKNDLILLARFLGLEICELRTIHYTLEVLPPIARKVFVGICYLFPGFRESWLMVARKPASWKPRLSPTREEFDRAFGSSYYSYDYESFKQEHV